ncbi:hypothetical protein AGMMS49925_08330 [Deltaproteobacteria bacterium]|nr:hypothetical protein AGMMS49925_08330 [Deltaproteobacteria bacterium]
MLAAQFGYLLGLLWILIGCVLAGGVHDMVVLFASVRHRGQSLAYIATQEIDKTTYTVAATIPIAVIMGLYMQIWRKGDVMGASVIGIVLLFLCILSGPWATAHPELFGWLDIDRKPKKWSAAFP